MAISKRLAAGVVTARTDPATGAVSLFVGGVQIPGVSFLGKFSRSIVPEVGPVPFWATNAAATGVATVADNLGVLRECRQGEFRFWGARRVENKLRAPNELTNTTYWSAVSMSVTVAAGDAEMEGIDYDRCYKLESDGSSSQVFYNASLGVLKATRHIFSIELRAGTVSKARISLFVSGGAVVENVVVTLSNDWQRFAIQGVCDGTSAYRVLVTPYRAVPAAGATIYARRAQVEDAAGIPLGVGGVAPPSEYVPRDLLALPTNAANAFYGAAVDGVRYFDTVNANTVDPTTRLVTLATGAEIADAVIEGLLIEPEAANLIVDGRSLSTWTINGTTSLSITANADIGPTGETVATRLTEDSANTSKWVARSFTASDNQRVTVQVCAKKPATNGRDFLMMIVTGRDAVARSHYFSCATGDIPAGQSTTGAPVFYSKALGNGWWLFALSVNVGAGATTPTFHVGISTGNGVSTYLGDGVSGILVDFAQAVLKEHPCSPIVPAATAQTRTGYSIGWELGALGAVVGLNDWSWYGQMTPWYHTGIANKTSNGTSQSWYFPFYFHAAQQPYGVAGYNRAGTTIRPYADSVAGFALCTFDRYLGNPVQQMKWTPNTFYPIGALVVPTNTASDNAGGNRLFRCVVAGISGGTEPTWNTTLTVPPDTTSNLTADNTVRWQANQDNHSGGNYEPYDGALWINSVNAWSRIKYASGFRASPADYWGVINGVFAERQTAPFPADKSEFGNFRRPIDIFRLGQFTGSYAYSSQSYRNVAIFAEDTIDKAVYQALTV